MNLLALTPHSVMFPMKTCRVVRSGTWRGARLGPLQVLEAFWAWARACSRSFCFALSLVASAWGSAAAGCADCWLALLVLAVAAAADVCASARCAGAGGAEGARGFRSSGAEGVVTPNHRRATPAQPQNPQPRLAQLQLPPRGALPPKQT